MNPSRSLRADTVWPLIANLGPHIIVRFGGDALRNFQIVMEVLFVSIQTARILIQGHLDAAFEGEASGVSDPLDFTCKVPNMATVGV